MEGLSYIRDIEIKGLWGIKDILWENLFPDVNILVGINGSGKTTLLNMMEAYYANKVSELKKYKGSLKEPLRVEKCIRLPIFIRYRLLLPQIREKVIRLLFKS